MLEYHITFPIDFLYIEIQHGAAVRVTSNSSKIITNGQAGLISSSEESDKKRRTKQHQKITLPTFEKTIQEAKLSWKRFIKYVKMTRDIDLKMMTNDQEILSQYRAQLEVKIIDIFI